MLIHQKLGNINLSPCSKNIDWLNLEWHETTKRILHKTARSGREITMKFLRENQNLTEGDIIYEDAETVIAIDIQPCEAIIVKPKNMFEMAAACYEIGNKHLSLFFQDNELLIAYEAPLFNLLALAGYDVLKENRKLINPLKTSVAFHAHIGSESLFSKMMKPSPSAE
ncbi:MAG: urease accessory protein UreE [Ginsengibacter sp.]